MLESIKEAIFSIADFFTMIIDFIISLVKDIVYVVELTGETIAKIPKLFAWLPAELLALLLAAFAVVVIYKVIGRD